MIQTGGNGYINEFPVGRILRDAKLYEIGAGKYADLRCGDLLFAAGTSEVRRMLIGRELFSETS